MGKKAKSFKNMVAVAISTIASTAMVFVARKFFIDKLGIEYNGINSLFSSIMSMLAVAELGIGSTIVFHLYRPIVDGDYTKVRSLMSLYKKIYYILGGIIFIIGMIVAPFIYRITGNVNIEYSLYIIFPLFVLEAAFSYFLSYKRSILFVHQDNYIIDAIHTVSILAVNTIQIIFLVLTGDFIVYLVIKIIFGVVENVVISVVANRKYKHIFDGTVKNVDNDTKASIKKLVKGSALHNVGGFFVTGTDSVLISMFINVSMVGYYANYMLIVNSLDAFFGKIINATAASVGTLIAEGNKQLIWNTYKRIAFFNFWLYSLSSIGIFLTISPLVSWWLGDQFIMDNAIVALISINIFIQGMRKVPIIFSIAAGIMYENRHVPIIESIINLAVSLALVVPYGVAGVIVGTIASGLFLHLYSYPKYVYELIFKQHPHKYLTDFIKSILIFLILGSVTGTVVYVVGTENFVFITLICLLVHSLLFIIIFCRNSELLYYVRMVKRFLVKLHHKVNARASK